ncbi:hypothetical protein KSP39_PZI013761 [Platanthera zijinensis]|uniref:CCHC-type domain-containing protein n=1 Tax=Platanthera zijinensis TaxID=2320716 RepID=A0AAP0BDB6_9ASPA
MKERGIFYTVQSDFATTRENVDEYRWSKDEDFCRDYLLNSLNPRLALTYDAYKTAKEIWDRLNAHFQKEVGLSKTLLGEKFFNCRFTASMPVISQVIEMENLRLKLECDHSYISDSLLMYLILNKLPLEWITFKTEMHRLKENITLDELKRFIHIEDQNIVGKSLEQAAHHSQTVNFVSRPGKSHQKPPTPKGDSSAQLAVKKSSLKRKNGKCHNCSKWGHWAAECRGPKKKEEAPQNVENMIVNNFDPKSFVALIGSSHRSASSEWWLDSGVICHVTNDRGSKDETCEFMNENYFSTRQDSRDKLCESLTKVFDSFYCVSRFERGETPMNFRFRAGKGRGIPWEVATSEFLAEVERETPSRCCTQGRRRRDRGEYKVGPPEPTVGIVEDVAGRKSKRGSLGDVGAGRVGEGGGLSESGFWRRCKKVLQVDQKRGGPRCSPSGR